jgi:hypothetical protein
MVGSGRQNAKSACEEPLGNGGGAFHLSAGGVLFAAHALGSGNAWGQHTAGRHPQRWMSRRRHGCM